HLKELGNLTISSHDPITTAIHFQTILTIQPRPHHQYSLPLSVTSTRYTQQP
ncbi:Hypothetical predicted protein, partial [Marmota monax]